MQNEAKQEATSIKPGDFVVTVGEGGGDLPDYEILEAFEPIKVNISDIKQEMGRAWGDGEDPKLQLRFVFKVAEGQPGAGQTYSKWVNAPTSNTINPKSGVYQVLSKLYVDGIPEGLELTQLLGQPCRIELGSPYESGGKNRQKVDAIKPPTKDQKKLEVVAEAASAGDDALAQATAAFGPDVKEVK